MQSTVLGVFYILSFFLNTVVKPWRWVSLVFSFSKEENQGLGRGAHLSK